MLQHKKIVIAGGSGFIGQSLAAYFGANNDVSILTRFKAHPTNNAKQTLAVTDAIEKNIRLIYWDGNTLGEWAKTIDGAEVLINLAGKSVNCRYNAANKNAIMESRVNSTRVLGEAVTMAKQPPKVWLNSSSATIYRHALDKPQDEYTGEIENDFSVQVCKAWEQTFFEANTPNTRKIVLRTAITLGNGSVMIPYLNLVKYFLGGKQGPGNQLFSWVHIMDVCRAIEFLIELEEATGVFNISSSNPVTNTVFMETLRQASGQHFGLPAPTWMLEIGAYMIGTETELMLKSRWVLPTKLLLAGFQFQYPLLQVAVDNIMSQMPRKQYHLF